jgi:hypothetical protein
LHTWWNAYRVLVGKPEGKSPLGRPRHRWEDNIKMEFRGIGLGAGGMDLIYLAQDCGWFFELSYKTSRSIKCWKILGWLRN